MADQQFRHTNPDIDVHAMGEVHGATVFEGRGERLRRMSPRA